MSQRPPSQGDLWQLMLWNFRDFFREPAALFWTLGFPILMTLTLGQIASKPPSLKVSVGVLAGAGEEAQAHAWALSAPGLPAVQWVVLSPAELPKALSAGRVRLAVAQAWTGAGRRWRLDPADAQALAAYHQLRDLLEDHPPDREDLQVEGTRYIDFLLPGLLALGLVNSCLWGIGWSLIELRQKKVLRLMLATPLRPGRFLTALFLSRWLLALAEAGLLLFFCSWLFKIRIQGSLPALLALWSCGLAAFFGLAVLVACRTDRSAVGQGLINAITLPMFVVSGVFFSLDNFPAGLQRVFRAFPPSLLVDSTRAIINAGAGLAQVARPCLLLLAIGAVFYGLGRRWFRFY